MAKTEPVPTTPSVDPAFVRLVSDIFSEILIVIRILEGRRTEKSLEDLVNLEKIKRLMVQLETRLR